MDAGQLKFRIELCQLPEPVAVARNAVATGPPERDGAEASAERGGFRADPWGDWTLQLLDESLKSCSFLQTLFGFYGNLCFSLLPLENLYLWIRSSSNLRLLFDICL